MRDAPADGPVRIFQVLVRYAGPAFRASGRPLCVLKNLATDREFYDVDVTYDRNSNITVVEDNIHTGFDVKYTIDDLNRLTDAQEGTYSGGSISSETRQQTWTLLDQLGNWEHVKLDLDGDNAYSSFNEYDDDRTHNVVNELTGRDTDDSGSDDYTLVYDAVGNLTDDDENYDYIYDTWGRLVEVGVTNSANVVAKFEYNGLNHRTLAHHDTDTDGDVDANDTKLWFAYNERWQLMAAFEDTESTPREEWVYHAAGADGRGGSSYIDAALKRWWDSDDNGSLDHEMYLCPNWRHDVSAIVTDTGKMLEWIKYTSYGVPMALPAGDTNSDFAWNATDDTAIQSSLSYAIREDADLNGTVDSNDITHANSITGSYQTLGWEVLSSTGILNFKGYAGYEWDRSAPELYHVRFRVLHAGLGRWTQRDPLGYVDGVNLYGYALDHSLNGTDPLGLCAGCGDTLAVLQDPAVPDGMGGAWSCLDALEYALKDPEVQRLLSLLVNCPNGLPRIQCCPPTHPECKNPKADGRFEPSTNRICICMNRDGTPRERPTFIRRLLIHELLHAWQACLGSMPSIPDTRDSCTGQICKEISAFCGSNHPRCRRPPTVDNARRLLCRHMPRLLEPPGLRLQASACLP